MVYELDLNKAIKNEAIPIKSMIMKGTEHITVCCHLCKRKTNRKEQVTFGCIYMK